MTRLELIAAHKDMIKAAVGRHVEKGQGYALVDFPHHPNVGDSAIWLGEIVIMREVTGRLPAYVSTKGKDFDTAALRAAVPDGPIFIHGGGNFGDIWPHHQVFRLEVLNAFPDRRVIQLPQSVHFEDQAAREETSRAVSRHGNFHMMVRDQSSVAKITAMMDCPIELLPDSAFGIGSIARSGRRDRDALFLLRTDKEKVAIEHSLLAGFPDALLCDWLEESRLAMKRVYWKSRLQAGLSGKWSRTARRVLLFQNLAQARVDRGLALIDGSARVLTDRLHVHILSTLLGVPHVALDNYYGKIGGYMDEWTGSLDIVHRADDIHDAIEILRRLP